MLKYRVADKLFFYFFQYSLSGSVLWLNICNMLLLPRELALINSNGTTWDHLFWAVIPVWTQAPE